MAAPNSDRLERLPVLAIQNRVLFPGGFLRLKIGKPKSVRFIESVWAAQQKDKHKKTVNVAIFSIRPKKDGAGKGGKDADDDDVPDVYPVGCMARIEQLEKTSDNNKLFKYSLLVQGVSRIERSSFVQRDPHLVARVQYLKVGSARAPANATLHAWLCAPPSHPRGGRIARAVPQTQCSTPRRCPRLVLLARRTSVPRTPSR
jgi:ATP-dependent Lon protease